MVDAPGASLCSPPPLGRPPGKGQTFTHGWSALPPLLLASRRNEAGRVVLVGVLRGDPLGGTDGLRGPDLVDSPEKVPGVSSGGVADAHVLGSIRLNSTFWGSFSEGLGNAIDINDRVVSRTSLVIRDDHILPRTESDGTCGGAPDPGRGSEALPEPQFRASIRGEGPPVRAGVS